MKRNRELQRLKMNAIMVVFSFLAINSFADKAVFDGAGRLAEIVDGDERMVLESRLGLVSPSWRAISYVGHSAGSAPASWSQHGMCSTNELTLDGQPGFRVTRRFSSQTNAVTLRIDLKALQKRSEEGFFLWLMLPTEHFAGGACTLKDYDMPLPKTLSASPRILGATAQDVQFHSREKTRNVEIALSRETFVTLQDERSHGLDRISLLVKVFNGQFNPGEQRTFSLRISASIKPDHSPILLEFGEKTDSTFDGFGGSYCYALDKTNFARKTLRHYPHTWTRIRASLPEWEPRNDNEDPARLAGWVTAQDRKMPAIRREMRFARTLTAQKHQLILSAWDLPLWMYAEETRDQAFAREINPALWPEVYECVTGYLLHLRSEYGVEPEMFSFNEPIAGVRTRIPPAKMESFFLPMLKRWACEKIKTKLLIGDVASPRYADQITPILNQTGLTHAASAIGFHSWGHASPETYSEWYTLAQQAGIPLFVTELGSDPSAWFSKNFVSDQYAYRDSKVTLDCLRYATPRIIMPWEFSQNYELGFINKNGDFIEYLRGAHIHQLLTLTPKGRHRRIKPLSPDAIPVAAVDGADGSLVLHILNTGSPRPLIIKAAPRTTPSAIALKEDQQQQKLHPRRTRTRLSLQLPGSSLVSVVWPPAADQ